MVLITAYGLRLLERPALPTKTQVWRKALLAVDNRLAIIGELDRIAGRRQCFLGCPQVWKPFRSTRSGCGLMPLFKPGKALGASVLKRAFLRGRDYA